MSWITQIDSTSATWPLTLISKVGFVCTDLETDLNSIMSLLCYLTPKAIARVQTFVI